MSGTRLHYDGFVADTNGPMYRSVSFHLTGFGCGHQGLVFVVPAAAFFPVQTRRDGTRRLYVSSWVVWIVGMGSYVDEAACGGGRWRVRVVRVGRV